jgi:hypothetical protein
VADFIGPVLDWLMDVVTKADLGGLEAWGEVRKSWTGICAAWPPVAVMARNTGFDPEGNAVHETHEFTIKFGVNGDDPEQIVADAIAYMKALDAAVNGASWIAPIARVVVLAHDYGPMFAQGGNFAVFPDMHLEVEAYEF